MTRVVIDVCRPKLLCTVRDMQRAELILLAVVALQVAGVQVLRCSAWGCSKKDESLIGICLAGLHTCAWKMEPPMAANGRCVNMHWEKLCMHEFLPRLSISLHL